MITSRPRQLDRCLSFLCRLPSTGYSLLAIAIPCSLFPAPCFSVPWYRAPHRL